MDNENIIGYHSLSIEETLEKLKTSKQGLSEKEARSRISIYGLNQTEIKNHFNYLEAIFENLKNPFSVILTVATVLSFVSKHYIDAFVIIFVIAINLGIDMYHKKTAHINIELLKKNIIQKTTVLRDGLLQKELSVNIVPGDIIHLEEGDTIPADGRLIQVDALHINESLLTGESQPVKKDLLRITGVRPVSDFNNMVWLGSTILEGSGVFVVTATGFKSRFGNLIQELSKTKRGGNPFLERTKKLSKSIGFTGILVTLVLFSIQFGIMNQNFTEIIIFSLAFLVSIIPESLPTVMNITLSRGARYLAEEQAVAKELSTVESIGATTVILTDKTGTLTENTMRVENIVTKEGKEFTVTGFGWKNVGMFLHHNHRYNPTDDNTLLQIIQYSLLGNRSQVYQKDEQDIVIGEPTEAALLVMAEKSGLTRNEILQQYNILQRTRFLPRHKVLITTIEKNSKKQLLVIGAPETIWEYTQTSKEAKQKTEHFAEKGLRTIAFAYADINATIHDFEHLPQLEYLGFVAMRDPIREGVKETIQKAKEAGIRIIMATGDHLKTAKSIADEIGITHKHSTKQIMNGLEFLSLNEKEQKDALKNITVFARVTPEIKLQIIKILQKEKEVVTMIGDGMNDILALRCADIGVGMGDNGTDAARNASSIILTNNNFITIIHAIFRGRHVFQNIRHVTSFLLSTNAAEAFMLIIVTFLGMPLPLIATQILLVNLVTDGFGALPFAFQKPELTIIKRPRKGILLDRFDYGIIISATIGMTVASLIAFSLYAKTNIAYAQSMTFLTLSLTQIARLVSIHNKKSLLSLLKNNVWFIRTLGISFGILIIVFNISFLREIFSLQPLQFKDVYISFFLSLLPLVTVGIYKITYNNYVRITRH